MTHMRFVVQMRTELTAEEISSRFDFTLATLSYEYALVETPTLTVGAHQSLLEALEQAGIAAPWLCRGGACGQCETDVIACDGTIDHHDHWLEPQERARKIMPCVSRFRGTLLTIDR